MEDSGGLRIWVVGPKLIRVSFSLSAHPERRNATAVDYHQDIHKLARELVR